METYLLQKDKLKNLLENGFTYIRLQNYLSGEEKIIQIKMEE